MVVDNEVWHGNSLIHHTENYYPFPSKTFALLFFHLHSPRPMVCTACIYIYIQYMQYACICACWVKVS